MILAEKIAYLRKQKNWSQEQLADVLEISRQSVSKWESGASIPELDKIIGMSKIFGVSTDFLLKDEYDTTVLSMKEQDMETQNDISTADCGEDGGRKVHVISLEEANAYLQIIQNTTKYIALGVAICILSPVCLLLLGGWSEFGPVAITEDMAAGLGIIVLLLMVAAAVVLFILNGMKQEPYEYLEKEEIRLQYGVSGIVLRQREAYTPSYRKSLALGVTVCILGVLPILVAMGFQVPEIWQVYCTCLLFPIEALGAYLLVDSGSRWGAYQKLLQEGDYTPQQKQNSRWKAPLVAAYWCLVTAIYLGINFRSGNWSSNWQIWPVAALLFVVVIGILNAVTRSRDRK